MKNARSTTYLTLAFLALVTLSLRLRDTYLGPSEPNRPADAAFRVWAERLCWNIAPQAGPLSLTLPYSSDRQPQREPQYCAVTCADTTGAILAEFTWDAWTGNLVTCTILPAPPEELAAPSPPIGKPQAIAAARFWLCRLEITPPKERWELAFPPQRQARKWHLSLKSAHHRASLSLNEEDGALVYAKFKAIPETNAPESHGAQSS